MSRLVASIALISFLVFMEFSIFSSLLQMLSMVVSLASVVIWRNLAVGLLNDFAVSKVETCAYISANVGSFIE